MGETTFLSINLFFDVLHNKNNPLVCFSPALRCRGLCCRRSWRTSGWFWVPGGAPRCCGTSGTAERGSPHSPGIAARWRFQLWQPLARCTSAPQVWLHTDRQYMDIEGFPLLKTVRETFNLLDRMGEFALLLLSCFNSPFQPWVVQFSTRCITFSFWFLRRVIILTLPRSERL